MNGGIVHWAQRCSDEEAAFVAGGGSEDAFECSYYEYQVFAWNLIGLIAITLWSGGLTALLFYLLNLAGMLRYDFHVIDHMNLFLILELNLTLKSVVWISRNMVNQHTQQQLMVTDGILKEISTCPVSIDCNSSVTVMLVTTFC